MTEDIKIVDLSTYDTSSLTSLYKEGWVIERTIQYTLAEIRARVRS